MASTSDMPILQVKTIPIPSEPPQQPVPKQQSIKKQGTRYITQSAPHTKLHSEVTEMLNFLHYNFFS